jgi:hypothetical protein
VSDGQLSDRLTSSADDFCSSRKAEVSGIILSPCSALVPERSSVGWPASPVRASRKAGVCRPPRRGYLSCMGALNVISLRQLAGLRDVARGGGPKVVRLVRVGEPRGLLVPRSELIIEIEARNGATVRLDPTVPMPFVLGWTVRLARMLNAPLVSAVDPESFSFSLRLPRLGHR